MSELPEVAYKVLTAAEMAALEHEGSFAGAPVDLADGFIHLSTAEQLDEVESLRGEEVGHGLNIRPVSRAAQLFSRGRFRFIRACMTP